MKNNDFDRDYLSVSKFAKFVGIKASSLRHYDKKDIFKPAGRGKGETNEYRRYSPMQITTVKMIRVLTEIGVPLKTIRELTYSRTPEKILKLLSANRDKVLSEIRFLQDVHSVINTFTELLNEAMSATEEDIIVSEMYEKHIILGEVNEFYGEGGFMQEFLRFCNGSFEPKLNTSYPIGGFFEDMGAFLSHPSRPTRFFAIDPKGNEKKEAGLYLIGYTRGYYGETGDLPERMEVFAKKNGLEFNGPVYNIFLTDEISEIDHERYLLQVSVPVKETRRVPSRRLRRRKESN